MIWDNSYALSDNPKSGELFFMAPVVGRYEIRVVRPYGISSAIDYYLYVQVHDVNHSSFTSLEFPDTYTR